MGRFYTLILCLCASILSGCVGGDIIPVVTDPLAQNDNVKVFVATTREKSLLPFEHYSKRRSANINYSEFNISVPSNRLKGSLAYPLSATPNLTYRFAAASVSDIQSEADFVRELNQELMARAPENRQIFLGLHGYNNTFSEGLLRSAQLVHDYQIEGVPVHFSWPSGGKLHLYVYDQDSAHLSKHALVSTIRLLARTKANSIVIFAHSMGSFLTMEALVELYKFNERTVLDKIAAIALAAPDIDDDIFQQQLDQLVPRPSPFILFVNQKDRALRASQRIRDRTNRVGQGGRIEQLRAQGLAIFDLTEISDSDDRTFHGVHASSPTIIDFFTKNIVTDAILNATDQTARDELWRFEENVQIATPDTSLE